MADGLLLFITGLALFLFAMSHLSNRMQRLISARMRGCIKYSVRTPLYGLVTGIITTILFQSSSATTLVTVGMVSAGIIGFFHSLGIILGADIGTTLTVQLVAWHLTQLSPLIITTGGLLWVSGKPGTRTSGEAIFYFGLLFFALNLTGAATGPLRHDPMFMALFQNDVCPLLGVAIGVVFTGIVQASAIPISILVILAQQDLVTLQNAVPIVLGANMGTTATAFLAAVAANVNGRRTALAHFGFKLAGVVVRLPLLGVLLPVLESLAARVPQQVVLSHVIYNCLVAGIFMPALKPVAAFMERIVPGRGVTLPMWPEHLDGAYINKPQEALECVRLELLRGLILCRRMLTGSIELIASFREGTRRDIGYIEMIVDNLQDEIGRYLDRVSCQPMTEGQSQRLFAFSAIVDDIERVGDRALNMSSLARHKRHTRADFTPEAEQELDGIVRLVFDNLGDTVMLVERTDKALIPAIVEREEDIDTAVRDAVQHHFERFRRGACHAAAGPIFVDILINLERISDHCENIAEHFATIH
jgi:phosphate:Na+ symporter